MERRERLVNGTGVTEAILKEKGIIRKSEKRGRKVLGRGELTKKLTVKANKVSAKAKEIIESAGGTVEVI